MSKNQKNAWYLSSSGEGLSLTIGSLSLGGLVPVLAILFNILGVDLSEIEITKLIGAIISIISSLGVVVGLGRKIYYAIKNKS